MLRSRGGIEEIKPNAEDKFCRRRYQKAALSKISSFTSISPKKDGSEAIYLKSQGVKHKDIYRLCQISKTTLTKYIRQYQKCKLVNEKAEALGIELCYLPAYSPQLNLIERLWKFVRNECLYSKYYANFADFKAAISTCVGAANTEQKEKLDSLLTLNFQSFTKVQILTV